MSTNVIGLIEEESVDEPTNDVDRVSAALVYEYSRSQTQSVHAYTIDIQQSNDGDESDTFSI